MPKITRGILLVSVGLLLLGLASTIDAQEQPRIKYKPDLKTIVEQTLKKTIAEKSRKIQEWEWDAKVTLGLAVTIGLLGILAGLLQAKTSPLARNLTIIVGATISVIVVINENIYNKDHRSLKALAIEGRNYLNQIQNIIDFDIHLVHNNLDLLKLLKDGNKVAREFDKKLINTFYQTRTAWDFLTSTAYAGGITRNSQGPAWMTVLPEVNGFRFYRGVGEGHDLTLAEENAVDDVLRSILRDTELFSDGEADVHIPESMRLAMLRGLLEMRDRHIIASEREEGFSYNLLAAINVSHFNMVYQQEQLFSIYQNAIEKHIFAGSPDEPW